MIRRLFVVLALALLLAGCTDPEKVERANAIRRESEALYLATATHVAMEAKAADVAIAATATAVADEEAVRAATQAERIARQETVIDWTARGAVVFVVAAVVAFCIVSIGGSVAASRKANLEARLVKLDRITRTFPILLQDGWLVDLETGERARLDQPSQPHTGRLIGSIQARVVGLLAHSAEKVAKSTKDAKPGDMLPAIGQSVPLLEGDWLPELKGANDETARDR